MSGSKTIVHLLRHGEVHNPDGILYGRIPGFGLSDLGREMALAAAESL
ncbi:MAG TPA: histidine phosphatase family protein, partial [Glycomyces sp.]|nr:histidine phosphatase family protein [Glycomyces sp.]